MSEKLVFKYRFQYKNTQVQVMKDYVVFF